MQSSSIQHIASKYETNKRRFISHNANNRKPYCSLMKNPFETFVPQSCLCNHKYSIDLLLYNLRAIPWSMNGVVCRSMMLQTRGKQAENSFQFLNSFCQNWLFVDFFFQITFFFYKPKKQ